MKTPVVVIGTDHQNTLAVLRCLGKNECTYQTVICGSSKHISKSKYCKNLTCIDDSETSIYDYLKKFNGDGYKHVLFPCSDRAMYVIDKHAKELEELFYIPGFKNNHGFVTELMDKYKQAKFCEENGIRTPKTWSVSLNHPDFPETCTFPCIIKPEISANGRKADIKIVNSIDEFKSAVELYLVAGYSEFVVQPYLKKICEGVFFGVVLSNENKKCIGNILKRVTEWPVGTGSTACGVTIADLRFQDFNNNVISVLRNHGFCGMIDIEYLLCEEGIYLNEINFRHSGNGYLHTQLNVPLPLMCCADLAGEECDSVKALPEGKVAVQELCDAYNWMSGRISFKEYRRHMREASALALWDKQDKKVALSYYRATWKSFVGLLLRRMKLK